MINNSVNARLLSEELEVGEEGVAFNMAFAYLKRMDHLLRQANVYSRAGLLMEWKLTLDALYRELSPKVKKEELKELEKNLGELNNLADDHSTLFAKRNTSLAFAHVQRRLYTALHNHEVKLRYLLDKKGFLMPNGDPGNAINKGYR